MEHPQSSVMSQASHPKFELEKADMRRAIFKMRLLALCYVLFFGFAMFVQYSKFDFIYSLPQINRGSKIRENELEKFFHAVK